MSTEPPVWRDAVARVESFAADGTAIRLGTAFLVAPQLAVTALHVVGDRTSNPPRFLSERLRLRFRDGVVDVSIETSRCSRDNDWVLLRLSKEVKAKPVMFAASADDGTRWACRGFPDASPDDALDCAGTITTSHHYIGGVRALQLFCQEAAAGMGMPVKGLSGSPVVVDGAVIGVLRKALLEGGNILDIAGAPARARAGTLFAAPSETILEACVDLGLLRQTAPDRDIQVSVAGLPPTSANLFGRDQQLAELSATWGNLNVKVVQVVAWGGVGKSALINRWLREMGASYGGAHRVYAWSFYRQDMSGPGASAELFVQEALAWFGDPDPQRGSAWARGQRLAALVRERRTLLILDGLEPLQRPPGPQEGKLTDLALIALLRDLAAHNPGMCVITTRLKVADLSDFEGHGLNTMALTHLDPPAGAKLLRSLDVGGADADLESASAAFDGHALALTLLAGFIADAYDGDIRRRAEIPAILDDDAQGGHARRVMASYVKWLGPGAELDLLHLLGLFDRPADENVLLRLCETAKPGFTDHLAGLTPTQWKQLLTHLERLQLLKRHERTGQATLETHPLVREYFGRHFHSARPSAWRTGNSQLFDYYAALAPTLPETLEAMEPLFRAVGHGCRAGRAREAFLKVYLPRIMRGSDIFAARKLNALTSLIATLTSFFENGDWAGKVVSDEQGAPALNPPEVLTILMHAGPALAATRGWAAPELHAVYHHARQLSAELKVAPLLVQALKGLWIHHLTRGELQIAKELASEMSAVRDAADRGQRTAAVELEVDEALGDTAFWLGNFREAVVHLARGAGLYGKNSGSTQELLHGRDPGIMCLCYQSIAGWILGDDVIALQQMGKALSALPALPPFTQCYVLSFASWLDTLRGADADSAAKAERLVALAAEHGFPSWLAVGGLVLGRRLALAGQPNEGLNQIAGGIPVWRATAGELVCCYYLGAMAQTCVDVRQPGPGLKAIREALSISKRTGAPFYDSELHRLNAELLVLLDAGNRDTACAELRLAIQIAKDQSAKGLEARIAVSLQALGCGSIDG
jgi:hypothetical protein